AWGASAIAVARSGTLITIFRCDTTWRKPLKRSRISIQAGVPGAGTEIQRENGDPVQDTGIFPDTGHCAAVLRVPGQEEAILYRAPDRRNALLVVRAAPDRCIHSDSLAAARAPRRVVRPAARHCDRGHRPDDHHSSGVRALPIPDAAAGLSREPLVRRIAGRLDCVVIFPHSLAVPILVVCCNTEVTLSAAHA